MKGDPTPMLHLDVSQPLWPLVAIPLALMGIAELVNVIGGWL